MVSNVVVYRPTSGDGIDQVARDTALDANTKAQAAIDAVNQSVTAIGAQEINSEGNIDLWSGPVALRLRKIIVRAVGGSADVGFETVSLDGTICRSPCDSAGVTIAPVHVPDGAIVVLEPDHRDALQADDAADAHDPVTLRATVSGLTNVGTAYVLVSVVVEPEAYTGPRLLPLSVPVAAGDVPSDLFQVVVETDRTLTVIDDAGTDRLAVGASDSGGVGYGQFDLRGGAVDALTVDMEIQRLDPSGSGGTGSHAGLVSFLLSGQSGDNRCGVIWRSVNRANAYDLSETVDDPGVVTLPGPLSPHPVRVTIDQTHVTAYGDDGAGGWEQISQIAHGAATPFVVEEVRIGNDAGVDTLQSFSTYQISYRDIVLAPGAS
mgnify:CR=1 FL=1